MLQAAAALVRDRLQDPRRRAAAIENAGRSCVTTLLAPITQRSPIVTPLVTTTFAPSQTLSPIRVGPFELNPCQGTGRSRSPKRWLARADDRRRRRATCARLRHDPITITEIVDNAIMLAIPGAMEATLDDACGHAHASRTRALWELSTS